MTDSFNGGAASSRLSGTNDLQSAINSLTTAVKSNTDALKSTTSNAPGGTPQPFGSTGQTFTSGSFPKMASGAFSGAQSLLGGGASYATGPGGTGGSGGPGGFSGAMGNPAGTLGQAGNTMYSGVMGLMGNNSGFSNRVLMNQFASMSTLGMSPGTSLQQGFAGMYKQAFGYYGQNINALANNPADAAQMYSTLQSIAGSPYVNSTALGRAGFGAAAGFGIAGMGQLSGAQSAQAAAQLYSPQTSYMMRQLGYGQTPRAQGGMGNPMQMGQVVQSILSRAYGGKTSVNQQTLNAGLANGGHLNLNLQALGLDPSTMGPALQMYNKLFQQGLNPTQAQALLNDASQNKDYQGQSAQKTLSNKYGIATSDLQKLKDTTANQTSTASGEMGGFDTAVGRATTTVQKFDTALAKILKDTGLGQIIGGMSGLQGVASGVGGLLGKVASTGLGMLSRFGGAAGTQPGGQQASKPGSTGNGQSPPAGNSRIAQNAIKDAESQLGRAYVWGGDSPSVGFDCSGLVEWAYGQAGIRLPRTSEEQWAALKNRSVPLDKVMAGDIVFSSGADGTPNNPGHEAMMVSSKQIIEAPFTGANIRIRAFDPAEWAHAARPNGNLSASGGGGGTSGSNGTGSASSTTGKGNTGLGMGSGGAGLGLAAGSYGSSSEQENVSSALLGGISGGSGGAGLTTFTGSLGGSAFAPAGNGQGSAKGGGKGNQNVSTAGGGSAGANRALGQKIAKEMYGWTGAQWQALDKLWGTYESGWRNTAQNPGSTAFGIAQFLDSTWKGYGAKTSSPGLQIKYGLEYIHDRYKDPVKALAFELSHNPHWYDGGTDSARRGFALVGERGPELVRLSGGQQVVDAGRTRDMLKGTHAKASQTPWSAGTAAKLVLGNNPQNNSSGGTAGKCEVNLNMPQGAIVIHTNGSSTDVSNNVRQIMEGISTAMSENETLKKIMEGVTS